MSIIRLDRSWLTTTPSFILIYMSSMEAISYKPLKLKFKIWRKKMLGVGGNNQTVKYGKYLIRTFWVKIQYEDLFLFFRGPGGHYIKSRVPGHQNVSKCIFHHSGDIYIHMEKQLLKKCFKNAYLWLFEGPWEGPSVIRLGVSCSSGILSPISLYMWNKEAIWEILFKFKSKIWKQKSFFHSHQTPGFQIFRK